MIPPDDERGTTLLEALFAASLLITLVAGTASLLVLAHRVGVDSAQATTATLLAVTRLQAWRAVPWRYEIDGTVPEHPQLAYSPPGALERDIDGYWDVVDEAGRPPARPQIGAAFVRRWSVVPIASGSTQARGLEVCVFAAPVDRHPDPLVCIADVRTRQP
jgi:hypothetical protein